MSTSLLFFLFLGILLPRGGVCEDVRDEDWRGKTCTREIDFDSDFQLTPYEPSSTVKNMHNMPRVTGESTFDLDDEKYVAGIVLMAIIFFAAGIIILVFIYGSTCLRVCGCCGCARKQSRIDSNKWKIAGFVVGGIVLIGLIFALVGAILMLHDVTDSIDSVDDDLLGEFERAIALINEMAEDTPPASVIREELEGTNLDGVTIKIDGKEIELIDAIVILYNGTLTLALELSEVLQDFVDDTREILEIIEDIVYAFEILVLCLMTPAFVFVIWLIFCLYLTKRGTKLPKWCGRTAFCAVFVILLLLVIVCFGLFAGEISLSVMLSDFCMSPDENTIDFFDGTSQAIVEFYINCELPPDVYKRIEEFFNFANQVADAISEIDGTDRDEILERIEQNLEEFLDVFRRLGCQNINQVYVEIIYERACDDLVRHAVLAWSGLVVTSLFLCPLYVIYDQSFGVKGNFQKEIAEPEKI